ncbi:hypothetical protein HY251_05865 [bacterium]|nr:hypothetical protein [bacterium]
MGEKKNVSGLAALVLLGGALAAQAGTTLPRTVSLDAAAISSFARAAERGKVFTFYEDDHQAFLEWARARLPESATVLFFTDKGRGDGWKYCRASYTLYPRRVLLGSPSAPISPVDFYVWTPLDRDVLERAIAANRISHVIIDGIPPALLLPALARRTSVQQYDEASSRYLIELSSP